MDKNIITRNFSRYARLYDEYADIQEFAARRLIEELPSGGIRDILEIGCGTGIYTRLLKEKFPEARIEALDISADMINVASDKLSDDAIKFIVADAETRELDGAFDLITSNAVFQWFTDIEGSIIRYKDALAENGLLAFSIFGPATFRELREVLKGGFDKTLSITSNLFLDRDGLDKVLRFSFDIFSVSETILTRRYDSTAELLRKIKYTGARGEGLVDKFMLNKSALRRLDEIYKTAFGGIETSYQIFFCKGFKI